MESAVWKYEMGYGSYKREVDKEEALKKKIRKWEIQVSQLGVEYSGFDTGSETEVQKAIARYKEKKHKEIEAEYDPEIQELKQRLQELKAQEDKIRQREKSSDSVCREKLQAISEQETLALDNIEKLSHDFSHKWLVNKIKKFDQRAIDVQNIMDRPLQPIQDVIPGKLGEFLPKIPRMIVWPPVQWKGTRLLWLNLMILLIEIFLVWTFVRKPAIVIGILFGVGYIVRKIFLYKQFKSGIPAYSAIFYFDKLVEQIRDQYTDEAAATRLKHLRKDRGSRESRLIELVGERDKRLEVLDKDDCQNMRRETLELLRQEYEEKGNELEEAKNSLNKCRENLIKCEKKKRELAESLEDMEEEFGKPMTDKTHNQGVMTPSFFVSFSEPEYKDGPKVIRALSHQYKPTLILYDKEVKKNNIEEFHRRAAELIQKIMFGILMENHYSLVKLTLVDFETGGALFPAQRTSSILTICKNSGDFTKLVASLEQSRDAVNRQGDGIIANVNPERVANQNQPLSYQVVIFYGYEESAFGRDFMQLYQTGSLYGFLPILFLSQQDYQELERKEEDRRSVLSEMISFVNEENCYWYDFSQAELQKYNKTKNLF